MTIEKYSIGQKIMVSKKTDANMTEYYSVIQNIKGNEIYIAIPYRGESPLVLTHDEIILVKYVKENAAFLFPSRYLGKYQETRALIMYRISEPSKESMKRVQLRKFVRVALMLDVKYRLAKEDDWKKGTAVDLSAGGLRLAVKQSYEPGDVLDLYFEIESQESIRDFQLKGEVVRCILADADAKVYHLGIKFVNINRGMEDSICSFVFEKQMAQIRKR